MLTIAALARALLYSGVLIAFGVCGVEWFALAASGASGAGTMPGDTSAGHVRAIVRHRRRALAAWLAVLVALLLLLVAQFLALELAPTQGDLAMLLGQTPWGAGWSLMAAAALGGGLATGLRAPLVIRAVPLLALAAAMSGVGHAAADSMPLLARLLDTVHVVSIGTWIGTLLCMDSDATPRAWERFSSAAFVAAPLTVITGVGGALRRLSEADIAVSLSSDYGRLLAVKAAIVLVILVIGARHRAQVAARGAPSVASVRVELVLAVVVLLVTSVLTGTAPLGE